MSVLDLLDYCFFLGTHLDIRIFLTLIDVKKQVLIQAMQRSHPRCGGGC